jgi:hypothetical protein
MVNCPHICLTYIVLCCIVQTLNNKNKIKIKKQKDLKNLKMVSSNIDSYITTFTKLLKMAGYLETEHGSLALFK